MAALLQASKSYFKLHGCRSSDLIRASFFEASATVLDGAVQLVLTDPPYSARRLKKYKNSIHNNLSFTDMTETVELVGDLLRPGGHAILFCKDQQFAVWHTIFCAHKPPQNDCSSLSFASTSKDKCMVSAALLTCVDDPSKHRNNPAGESCALANAVELALHVKNNVFPLAAEHNGELQTVLVCMVRFPGLQ